MTSKMFLKKIKYIPLCIFFGVSLSFCDNIQKISKDFVPLGYSKAYQISTAERQKVLSSLGNLTDITLFLPKNYVKDGSVDYTEALQNAVNSNSNILLPDFPLLINDQGLILKSGSTVVFNKNTVLVKKPTDKNNYDILKIKGVNNVKVYFANIIGDRYGHSGTAGEWGHGIGIWKSDNIYLLRPTVKYCWGDGIYINNGENIVINKAFVNNNRRNGMSIISGKNITIDSLLAANTDGTAPKAGIDLEPNNNQDELENININNLITYNNTQGLLMSVGAMRGKEIKKIGISVNNHIDDSSTYSLALHLDKQKINDSNITGDIRITNSNWINVKKSNILFNEKEGNNKIKVNISTAQTGLNKDTQLKMIELNSN